MNSPVTSIQSTLKSVFGFDTFREGQAAVITKILEGKSALAVFPTGSGKSLCYQISALHLDGLTLVISPLIALMKDQIDFFRNEIFLQLAWIQRSNWLKSGKLIQTCALVGSSCSTWRRNDFLMSASSRSCVISRSL